MDEEIRSTLLLTHPEALPVAAATGEGLDRLSRRIEETVHWDENEEGMRGPQRPSAY